MYRHLLFYIFFLLIMTSCKTVWHHASTESEQMRVSPVASYDDAEMVEMIAPYRDKLKDAMSVVLAENKTQLNKSKPGGQLGKWMADAMKQEAQMLSQKKIDFALQNYGGIRIPNLTPGDITVGKIYELMPFENYMAILTVDGAVLQQVLNKIASNKWWPVSDGLRFTVNEGVATDIFINGNALSLDTQYVICLPDYIANGGDAFDMLLDQEREDTEILIRDALINYLEKLTADGKSLDYSSDKRISYE